MTTEHRDRSPVRLPANRKTRFFIADKVGGGWSIPQSLEVKGSWVHTSHIYHNKLKLTTHDPPIQLRKLKSESEKLQPFVSVIFEHDIVAPSEIFIIQWIGMQTKPGTGNRALLHDGGTRSMEGKYV